MPLSDTTRRVADEEVERMIAEAYRDAVAMARQHRTEPLRRLSDTLLARDDLARQRSRRCSAAIARDGCTARSTATQACGASRATAP